MGSLSGDVPLDSIAHIIQTALAPVFLLTGLATLLNVLSTRLGRVNDHTRRVAALLDEAPPSGKAVEVLTVRLARLRRRSAVLVAAMVAGALAGTSTCVAILMLFVGALRDRGAASVLFASFGLAVACTTGSLLALLVETMLSWRGLSLEAAPRGRHVPDI
jgi:Protein of unknown function (DUF2721)